MNVLHITNEFSKKNFSISSLILFITSYLNKNYNFNYSIITSLLEENLFSKKNINIIDFSKWFDFLFNRQNLKKKNFILRNSTYSWYLGTYTIYIFVNM